MRSGGDFRRSSLKMWISVLMVVSTMSGAVLTTSPFISSTAGPPTDGNQNLSYRDSPPEMQASMFRELTEEHAIAVTDLNVLPILNLWPITVTARISNIGTYNETDILVNLTEDGRVVDQTVITWMKHGTSIIDSLVYRPVIPRKHVVCVEATAASGAYGIDCRSTIVLFGPPKNLEIFKPRTTLEPDWEEPPFQ
jgi:hypothetical protein